MIKKLQYKFIAITMGILLLVFATILITINVFMRVTSTEQTDMFLELVAAQDGLRSVGGGPSLFGNEDGVTGRSEKIMNNSFFYVKTDAEGNIWELAYDRTYELSADELSSYVTRVLSKSANKGNIDNFRYLIEEKSYGRIIVFAENSVETLMLEQLISVSMVIAAVSFVVLFFLVLALSRWAVKPVRIAFEKQRRFISDAGHELKTPLTVISANADVLQGDIGENNWLTYIKEQTMRMNYLVHDLLTLARADEGQMIQIAAPVDFSKTVLNTTLEFESKAFEENKHMEYEIASDITLTGNEQELKQLVSILVDNAIKHSGADGEIKIKLYKVKEKIVFSVFNTGEGIDEDEKGKIFERFYRSDASRSRETGGFGLGLSIAKSITETHKGKIMVDTEKGKWIKFTVII